MNLSHFSSNLITFDRSRIYDQTIDAGFKPRGLWLSDEDEYGWLQWCTDNEYVHDVGLNVCYEVTLKETANILYINTVEELLAIPVKEKYGLMFVVDWSNIAENYDGIIITPYQWKCRNHQSCFWYYGWDCASGCIWNLDAIDKFQLLSYRKENY